jgi:Acyl-CoA synthetases (AMP-forming)/AMP-acid ligases II
MDALAPLPKFDPQLVADTIAAYRVTVLPAVPSMYNVLLRLPDTEIAKFASLRYAISGGAALPVEVMRQFEAKFGKAIYEGDGPTECSPVTCVNPIGGLRKPGSVGLPVPNVEMKIVDDTGRCAARDHRRNRCARAERDERLLESSRRNE